MADERPETPVATGLNPTKLTVIHAAKVLSRIGGTVVTETMIAADLAAGAPVNADGTINLIHYAAWLIREIAHRD